MKINGILVVEGNNDKALLSSFIDSEIVSVNGLEVSCLELDFLKEASKSMPILIFTDPDKAGETIRSKILLEIPNSINISIDSKLCDKHNKHGVAEASKQDLINILKRYELLKAKLGSINLNDLYPLCEEKRDLISKHFHLGKCNNKTLIRRLNLLNISLEKVKSIL